MAIVYGCCFGPVFVWIILAGPSDEQLPQRSVAIANETRLPGSPKIPGGSWEPTWRNGCYGVAIGGAALALLAALNGAADLAVMIAFLGLLFLSVAIAWHRSAPTRPRFVQRS